MKRPVPGRQRAQRGSKLRSDARPLLGLFGLSGVFFWNDDEGTVLEYGQPQAVGAVPDHLRGLAPGRFQESIEWLVNGNARVGLDKIVFVSESNDFLFSLSRSVDVGQFLSVSLDAERPKLDLKGESLASEKSDDLAGQSDAGEIIECGPAEEVVPGQPELECAPPDPLADEIF